MVELNDNITELIWKAAHNNKSYGVKEAEVVSKALGIPLNVILKVINHAQRTPKGVEWDIIKSRRSN